MSTARSEPLSLPGLDWPVELRVNPRARRLTLRLDQRRERLRLTCPRGVSARRALRWAEEQGDWVARQLDTIDSPLALAPGTTIMVDGRPCLLEWRPDSPRAVQRTADRLVAGGPADAFPRRIAAWLKAEARRLLTEECAAIAETAAVSIAAVAIGDAATRWGSCSHDGRLRFNWRLVMAPPDVRRFVVAHEVAHRLHMDHGPGFRAAEASLFGADPAAARSALRRLSPGLRRVRLP